MTVWINISEETKAQAEALVLSGRYESIQAAIEAGIAHLGQDWIDEIVDLNDLSPEERSVVERGLAAVEAGDVVDGEALFEELRLKYQAMIAR